jgi:hypothetical protein
MTVPLRRLLILLSPGLAVAAVGWAFVTTLRPEPVLAARVYGGPCAEGVQRSLQIALVAAPGNEHARAGARSLRVSTHAGNASSSWRGITDHDGRVELVLDPCRAGSGPLQIAIESETGAGFARGTLAPSLERWQAALRQGGWLPGRVSGDLRLSVAPFEGALAVPFAAELVLHAESAEGEAAAGVELSFELDGATLVEPPRVTDARGDARARIQPEQHAISLRLTGRYGDGREGVWYGALPVVPGALHVEREGTRLRVRSPIVRERAYLTLVDETSRLAGALVPLSEDGTGGAEGWVELEGQLDPRRSPLWAVVSSEPDKRSAAVVGWPLRGESNPPRTFDAVDQLLLDGLPEAQAAERATRQGRRRNAALFAAIAGALGVVSFVSEVRGTRRRAAPVGTEARALPAGVSESGAALALALVCLTVGLAALVWFGTLNAP